jgi:hypothetical protein
MVKDKNIDSVLIRLAGEDFFGNFKSKVVNKLLSESD